MIGFCAMVAGARKPFAGISLALFSLRIYVGQARELG